MIARVFRILLQAGYRIVPPPLRIVDVDFQSEFPAVLTGPHKQNSLIVVVDSDRTPFELTRRRIKALTTTLDRSGSEIPLTLVLIVSDSDISKTESLDTLCRVVRVFNAGDPGRDLRPLLPLALPEPAEPLPSALPALLKKTGPPTEDKFVALLIETAKQGQTAVADAVRSMVDKVASQYLENVGGK